MTAIANNRENMYVYMHVYVLDKSVYTFFRHLNRQRSTHTHTHSKEGDGGMICQNKALGILDEKIARKTDFVQKKLGVHE